MAAKLNIEILIKMLNERVEMSFSSQVKEELKNKIDTAKHCQIAELAAIMAFCANTCNQWEEFCITTENNIVADVFIQLIKYIFNVSDNDIILKYEGKKNNIITIKIKDKSITEKILMAIKWNDSERKMLNNSLLVQKECCKRAFIRGAFLAAGSISDPNKSYHYEIVCANQTDAIQLKEMLAFFELDAKVIARKNNFITYIKEGNHITDCLNVMGAFVSQMDLYNVMILKGMRNDVNRKVNCETANINKTVEAAVKQIKDIEYIKDTVGLCYLKEPLYNVAVIRLENPDMNLKDIGERLSPPVGKSGVNHRLRKISDIAQALRKQ